MTTGTKRIEILLVEDNILGREIVSSMLKDSGYACKNAKNGEEALQLMAFFPFDLVLMDVEMPVMDRLTATKKIREKFGNNLPVIALTAHHASAEKEKCLAAGMNACLVKPLQPEDLDKAIRKALHQDGENISFSGAASPAGKKLVDLTYLEQITKGNENFFRSMLDIFMEQNPDDLKALGKAVDAKDFEAIRTFAHKIKTSVVFVGLDKHIREQLAEMEELGKLASHPERIRELYAELTRICAEADRQLKEMMSQRKNKTGEKL